jgi:hypothetical protein
MADVRLTDDDRERYRELAIRLCGAAMSCSLGLRSVDYTLKHYIRDTADGEGIGDHWIALAKIAMEQPAAESRRSRE